VTHPREGWSSTNSPTVSTPAYQTIAYQTIVSSYYLSNCYHWDANAQAAHLSLTNAQAADGMFISYDDASARQAKVSYARNRGLGGIIIWELSQGYFANQSAGQDSPLIQALSQSLATPQIVSAEIQRGKRGLLL